MSIYIYGALFGNIYIYIYIYIYMMCTELLCIHLNNGALFGNVYCEKKLL